MKTGTRSGNGLCSRVYGKGLRCSGGGSDGRLMSYRLGFVSVLVLVLVRLPDKRA